MEEIEEYRVRGYKKERIEAKQEVLLQGQGFKGFLNKFEKLSDEEKKICIDNSVRLNENSKFQLVQFYNFLS